MSLKMKSFEIENMLRVKAVSYLLDDNGLFIMGGKNEQGKSSVLKDIMWMLGGDRYKPDDYRNWDMEKDKNPYGKIILSDGLSIDLIVERGGKNAALKITDTKGMRGGQRLLDEFIGQLALDLPKFMESNDKEKAKYLLNILGLEKELQALDEEEESVMDERKYEKQTLAKKKAILDETPYYKNAPKEEKTLDSLLEKQQDILDKNEANRLKREALQNIYTTIQNMGEDISYKEDNIIDAEKDAAHLKEQILLIEHGIENSKKIVENRKQDKKDTEKEYVVKWREVGLLEDETLDEVKQEMLKINDINKEVAANAAYDKAKKEKAESEKTVVEFDNEIKAVRQKKVDMLNAADMPLEGLSIQDGALTYKGAKWGTMASSEQLKVSVAIIQKLNPQCGFVLMDKLEGFDDEQLVLFGEWLVEQDLQLLGTKVSTGSECSIIIEDGEIKNVT